MSAVAKKTERQSVISAARLKRRDLCQRDAEALIDASVEAVLEAEAEKSPPAAALSP